MDDLAETEPPDVCAVGAFEGDQLVAVGMVGAEGEPGAWRVRGMATEPARRGRGAGTAVLAALLAYARSQGAERIWASVRVPARSLYERAGFTVVSEEFEPEHIGPHVIMSTRPLS